MKKGSALDLHHIGYVVAELTEGIYGFCNALLAEQRTEIFVDELQGVRGVFISSGLGQTLVELLQPLNNKSPVWAFLTHKGGGLHHLCYEIDDCDSQLKRVRSEGGLIVSRPKPAVAFGGRRIGWALTRQNLLLEFLERNKHS